MTQDKRDSKKKEEKKKIESGGYKRLREAKKVEKGEDHGPHKR